MKKVAVITGTRADYGIYYPMLQAIQWDDELELHLIVTGMHLSPNYGYTIDNIKKDGFPISARIECLFQGDTHGNMARSIGMGIMGMTQAFETVMPDCVVVLGDRGEMLAAAIVSTHMNIPLIHLHGGEVSGTIDESVRHAISKLAHVHLVATEGSKERLIRMGEDPWRIEVVGAPRVETIENTALPSLSETKHKYQLDFTGEYLLFVYHPVTTEDHDLAILEQMLEVLLGTDMNLVCIMPNSDAGSDKITSVYKKFYHKRHFHAVTNFGPLDYLTMLKHTVMLVGNSSSGIIEAASFRVPVINIGSRQKGRERSDNVIDILENKDELIHAIGHVQGREFQQSLNTLTNVYGRKNTSLNIVRKIKELVKSEQLIQKTITY